MFSLTLGLTLKQGGLILIKKNQPRLIDYSTFTMRVTATAIGNNTD
jgi:hypothetical protein